MGGGNETTRLSPYIGAAGMLRPGLLLNGIYRIEERLGAGGMGEVYRATNIANDECDAIKVIGRALATDPTVEALFRKEARVVGSIHSPAVARLKLFARDQALDVLYFVTEYIPGPSLLDRLRERAATPDELRVLLRRMGAALVAVHDAGAVHRDLSPDNIILAGGNLAHAKIIDFGIVKELDANQPTVLGAGFAGKFGYIAPEQLGFTGAQVGPWTDLYSLALVAIAFARGSPLGMGHTMGTAEERRREPIDLSSIPPELQPMFARMLAYDWRERLRNAGEMLAMLDGAQAGWTVAQAQPTAAAAPAAAWPEPEIERGWQGDRPAPARGGRIAAIGAAILLALALIAAAIWIVRARMHPALPRLAEPGIAVQLLPSGARYQEIETGEGGARLLPGATATVTVAARDQAGATLFAEQTGRLDLAHGTTLAEALPTVLPGTPAAVAEALPLMTSGAHWRLWPAAGGDTVVYDLTLTDVRAARAGLGRPAPGRGTPTSQPSATPGPVALRPAPARPAVPLPTPTRNGATARARMAGQGAAPIQTVPTTTPPPPPMVSRVSQAGAARLLPGRYFTDDDYPSSALRAEAQGKVVVRLSVGSDGRVNDCAVTMSSGNASLDGATCRIAQMRMRFTPARDDNGNAVASTYSLPVRWTLPSE